MHHGDIYVGTIKDNGKQYVGQHVGPDEADTERYCEGHVSVALNGNSKQNKDKYFYRAIRKHGENNVSFQIIYTAFDQEELSRAEDHFIVELDTLARPDGGGYNLKRGGANGKHSDASKARMSERQRVANARPETKANRRAANARPEVKKRRSDAAKARNARPDFKAKWTATNAKPEVKARRSASVTAAFAKPEIKERHLAAMARPQTKMNLSKASKAAWEPPDDGFVKQQQALEILGISSKSALRRIKSYAFNRCQWWCERDLLAWLAQRWASQQAQLNEIRERQEFAITKDLRWIHNGHVAKRLRTGEPMPDGWAYGRLHNQHSETNKGMRWITNGLTEMLARGEPLPIGWSYGRLREAITS